jgi:hypothetical protein
VSWAGMPRCVGGDSEKNKHDTVSYSLCIVTGGDGRSCTGQTLGGPRVSVLMPEHGEARYGSLDRTMGRAFTSLDAVDIAMAMLGRPGGLISMCQIGAVLLRIGPSETTKRYSTCPGINNIQASTWKCHRYAQTKPERCLL